MSSAELKAVIAMRDRFTSTLKERKSFAEKIRENFFARVASIRLAVIALSLWFRCFE
jgi:hypothetical protein